MMRAPKSVRGAARTLHARALRGKGGRLPDGLVPAAVLTAIFSIGALSGYFLCGGACAPPSPTNAVSFASRSGGTQYAFVFSTGRAGTQHLSKVLKSLPSPRTYITHEEESATRRTRAVVEHYYRRFGALSDEGSFNYSALMYAQETKLPFYARLARAHNASRFLYTGHVPLAFGLGPAFLQTAAPGAVRILRMRRDRHASALSLMALGSADEDPWGTAPRLHRRWFPVPGDAFTRLSLPRDAWKNFNRFQRWLWYVDDVECRWQALKRAFAGRFAYMEVSLEGVAVMDGGEGLKAVADFLGVQVNEDEARKRHNSIQHKGREKERFDERALRAWDVDYRAKVGECRLGDGASYRW